MNKNGSGSAPSPRLRGEGRGEGQNQNRMRGPDKTVSRSRSLRQRMTEAEKHVWWHLRARKLGGFKFVRQERLGNYIVDFLCREQKLVIEIDGGQHAGNIKDILRTQFLNAEGYRVIRFWNNEVLSNMEGVLQMVLSELTKAPHPTPLPVNVERESAQCCKS